MGADSWLCNVIFSKILITCVFGKQAKKRLSLKTQFKIEFLLPFNGSGKLLEKMFALQNFTQGRNGKQTYGNNA